jgi:hypothetical protein
MTHWHMCHTRAIQPSNSSDVDIVIKRATFHEWNHTMVKNRYESTECQVWHSVTLIRFFVMYLVQWRQWVCFQKFKCLGITGQNKLVLVNDKVQFSYHMSYVFSVTCTLTSKRVKFRCGAVIQHCSLIGLLYSWPPKEFLHSSLEALHTKQREWPQLAKKGTIDGI